MGYLISNNSFRIAGAWASINFGHSGRPGQVGGSGGGGGIATKPTKSVESTEHAEKMKSNRNYKSGYDAALDYARGIGGGIDFPMTGGMEEAEEMLEFYKESGDDENADRISGNMEAYKKIDAEQKLVRERAKDAYDRYVEHYKKQSDSECKSSAKASFANGDYYYEKGDLESAAHEYAEGYASYYAMANRKYK